MDELTFLDLAETYSVTVNMPDFGYSTEIHMPIKVAQAADGSYPDNCFFDPLDEAGTTLGTYDYRIFQGRIGMSPTQKTNWNAFMRNVAKGRAVNMLMRLGASNTKFYPFDATSGDNGDYTVREIKREQFGQKLSPYKWFDDSLTLVMVERSEGIYDAPATSQGDFYIGDIATGFMYPQDGITPSVEYSYRTDLTVSGAPSSVNGPLAGDSWTTSFELLCNTYNCFALVTELVENVRTEDVELVVPDNYSMFGIDQSSGGAGGTYTAKFLGSYRTSDEMILKVEHIGYDQFKIPLTFWMKSKAA